MDMTANRTLKKIGSKLRDESRDIVDAKLRQPLRTLVKRLATAEKNHELDQPPCSRRR